MRAAPARRAAVLAALLAAGTAASAGERMDSATNALPRGAAAAGGERAQSATNALLPVIGEELASSTASASATQRLGAGFAQVAHQPGPVTDLAGRDDVSVSSVTLTWSAPGYDGRLGALKAGTTYFIRVASFTAPDTLSDHRLANVTLSTSGVQPGAFVAGGATGLQPNTTYWARLWTVDAAGNVSFASNISTFVTLALPVALQPESFPGVFFTSITAHWVARPLAPPDASSMTAEGYVLEASSTNFGALAPGGVTVSSATTAAAQSTLTVHTPGLIVDKSYFLRVGALNWAGVPNWTALGSTDTRFQVNDPLAAAPAFPAVSSFSLTAAWDRNGNPSDSQYHAELSTASDFTGVVTATDTYNLFYATSGLTANTSYYFRVYASTRSSNSGWLVFPATATLAAEPLPAPVTFAGVFESSLTLRWLHGDNPQDVSSYTVVLSTSLSPPDGDAGDVVLASTRPAGAVPAATLTGLAPNTVYFAHIAALNHSGQPSAYVLVAATATDAAAPATPGFEQLSFSSAAVSFGTGGNALGMTTFTVVLSTVAAYPPGGEFDAAASTVPDAGPVVLDVAGLRPNATYHLFVRAEGFGADSAYAAGGSSATQAALPGLSPDAPSFSPVASSGFTLNWSSGSAEAGYDVAGTTYDAQVALNAGFAPALASSRTLNLSADFGGLSPNTTYFARAAAYSHHHGTWTAYADLGSSATLAAVPAAPFVFDAVDFTSMTIRWAANGNPLVVTTYTVALSTDNSWPNEFADTVLFTTAPGGAFPSASPGGLNSGTTYYLFIAALNHRGALTSYASFGSTRTRTSPKTWVAGSGTWQTAGNWSPAGVPQQTDAVTIAANVTVTADNTAAVSFSSLTLGDGVTTPTLVLSTGIASGEHVLIRKGATLTQGMASARLRLSGDLTMESGSLLNHSDNTGATLSAQLWLDVAGTFDLQAGATVSVTGLGYDGGATNGGPGFGPGGGNGSAASSGGGSGAGHGGAGGVGDGGALAGGPAYGSFSDPTDAGSGGGGGDAASGVNVGGAGGGVVRLSATTLHLAGRIEADGTVGGGGGASNLNRGAGGGGSGGTVNIAVQTLTGGGTVYALGGAGGADVDGGDDPGGGGGGGRVALSISQSGTACLISVSTAGGASGGGGAGAGSGGTFSSTTTLPAPSLSAVTVTSYSVTWQWNLVSNGENYQVFDELDGAVSPLLGSTEVSFTEEGLLPHTTYTRTVRVSACGAGTSSPDATAATLPSTPTVVAQPFLQVWTGSMTVSWQAFPSAPDEQSAHGYVVEASSTDFGALAPGGVVSSTRTENVITNSLSVLAPALSPNTTYYFRIAGLSASGALGPYAAMGSTPTLAEPPALQAPTFLGVHFTSITAQWAANGSAGYILEASSTDFGALAPGGDLASSTTWSAAQSTLTASEPPLSVDTFYYLRVGALNWAGRANYALLGGTRTRFQVNEPAAGAPLFSDLSSAAVTARWGGNGNPSDTLYHAEASLDPGFGAVTSTDTYDLFYSSAGLDANTTYYFRVFASTRGNSSGWTVLGATVTHAPFPGMAVPSFAGVSDTALSVRWDRGINPPDVSSYTVVVTTGFFWPNEHAGNVVLASTRPAGADPMASFTGLQPNTEYQVFVAALNWVGAPGAYAFAGSTATFPRPPSAPGFVTLAYSSAVVTFALNGNPAGSSELRVVLSTVPAYPPGGAADVVVDTTPAVASPALEVPGLSLDTTYYLFVRTNGFAHDSPFVAGGSSVTRAAAPGPSPDLPAYEPVSTTGFTLNWSSGTADTGYDRAGTTYYAQISPSPGFSPVTASSATFNLDAAFSGLSVNTTYYARAAAFSHHHGTWTAYADLGSSATLAAVPAAPFVFDAVHFSSMTIRWAANGNPLVVTSYTVALSTADSWPNEFADTVLFSTAPGGAFPSATPSGLNSGTTYYLFIAALNHRGASTAYAAFGSTRTKTSPKTWVGGVDLLWQTAGNWSPAGVPQQTDAVTIAANVTVTANNTAAISFSSLTLGDGVTTPTLILSTGIANGQDIVVRGGATLTQGMANARLRVLGDLTMESGSLLNHADNAGATLSAQLWLDVAGTFDLQAGATVSVTGLGYDGGAANGGQGFGPGKGSGSSVSSGGGSGAGHGGAGGAGDGGAIAGGSAYDSFSNPTDAGSGGGGGDTASGTNVGGAGGGIVRLSATTLKLAGRVEADGAAGGPGATANVNSGAGGGGSGGAVNIVVQTLTGGGTIYALGGAGGADADDADDPGGGGGGGRVALSISQSGTACLIHVSTHGGLAGGGSSAAGSGGSFSSTSTLPAPSLSATAVSSYSVTWDWGPVANGQNYQLFDESDAAVSPLLGSSAVQFTEEGLLPNTTYSRYVRVSACGAGTDSAAVSTATLTSTPTVVAAPFLEVWTESTTVAWQAFSAGGSQGYQLEASSTDFGALTPGGLTLTSRTTSNVQSSLSVPALLPNTTYFFRVAGLNWTGSIGSFTALGSTPTLALPVSVFAAAETFLSVQRSSVTAAWAARPASPPDPSSMTSAGYVLEASSSAFGALGPGAPLHSSVTFSVLASTLTLDGLDLSSTYYFRVGALNHAGRPHYAALPRLVFTVAQSTGGIELGAIDTTVALSTVSTSSMVVTNTGNVAMSYELSADTDTAASPWTLGDAPGVEVAVLQGLWDAGPASPPHAAFTTLLSSTARLSAGGGNYAGGQDGAAVPPGQSRTLWFRFRVPASTVANSAQRLRVRVRPVKP